MTMHIVQKKDEQTIIEVVEVVSWRHLPTQLWQHLKIRALELWAYRGLLQSLVVRDLKVRYKNSVLGILWSLLNPLFMMMVFTAVFTVMRGSAIANFPAFVLIGLLPWQFFQNSVAIATDSIVANAPLVNKIYFPREILIISGVISNLVNFLIALLVLFPILWFFGISLTQWALLLPLVLLIQIIFVLGIAFIVSTINVFYRDMKMIVQMALLAGFFLTPVFYDFSLLPKNYPLFGVNLDIWRLMFYLNPMASIIENYRQILFHGTQPAMPFVVRTLVTAIFFLIIGLAIFYRYHNRFGEEV